MTLESSLTSAPNPSVLAQVGRSIGTIVGVAIGYYAGMTLLIPAAFVFVIAFTLFKTVPSRKVIALPAAVLGGHVSWMVMGCLLLGSWSGPLPEIILLGGLTIWLLARPGKVLVIVLTILNLLEFIYSAYMLFQQSFATDMHKAHLVHGSLYLMAGVLLVQEFARIRREGELHQTSQPTATTVTPVADQPSRQP
jgi:hypothetical protein